MTLHLKTEGTSVPCKAQDTPFPATPTPDAALGRPPSTCDAASCARITPSGWEVVVWPQEPHPACCPARSGGSPCPRPGPDTGQRPAQGERRWLLAQMSCNRPGLGGLLGFFVAAPRPCDHSLPARADRASVMKAQRGSVTSTSGPWPPCPRAVQPEARS